MFRLIRTPLWMVPRKSASVRRSVSAESSVDGNKPMRSFSWQRPCSRLIRLFARNKTIFCDLCNASRNGAETRLKTALKQLNLALFRTCALLLCGGFAHCCRLAGLRSHLQLSGYSFRSLLEGDSPSFSRHIGPSFLQVRKFPLWNWIAVPPFPKFPKNTA